MIFEYKNIKSLNETEAAVYDYIIAHHEEVEKMNIRELADATFTSPSTILRTCNKLGCDGFKSFKRN